MSVGPNVGSGNQSADPWGSKVRRVQSLPDHMAVAPMVIIIIIIIIIIIKNEKIRVTLCENAAGALYIVNNLILII